MDHDKPCPASKAFLTSLQETCCNQEVTCPITFDDIPIGKLSIALPCNHRFSPNAIKTWLNEKSHQCPVCRRGYPKEPISLFDLNNTTTNTLSDISDDDVSLDLICSDSSIIRIAALTDSQSQDDYDMAFPA